MIRYNQPGTSICFLTTKFLKSSGVAKKLEKSVWSVHLEYGRLPFFLNIFHRYLRDLGQLAVLQSVRKEVTDDVLAGERQFTTHLKEINQRYSKAKFPYYIVYDTVSNQCNLPHHTGIGSQLGLLEAVSQL